MKSLSPGKIRGLQACATPQGIFTILAIDHRDALRSLIAPEAPQTVSAAQLTDLKLSIVKHLAGAASAVLLDPLYSAGQAIVSRQLPGHVGLLCALEEQGYLSNPYSRQTSMLNGWSVAKARRLGVNGVKVLLFYHPEAEAAEAQERLVRSIAADCQLYDVPFFLEPIAYSLEPEIKKTSPEFAAVRRQIVVETVRRLSSIGPDVMKVEFPVDVAYEPNQAVWAEACAELDEVSEVPWTLLSAGDSFEIFKQQLRIACQAGCSGFLGGRAIWQEAVGLSSDERPNFLQTIARQRFIELQQIALEYGTPWPKRYNDTPVDEHWFQQY